MTSAEQWMSAAGRQRGQVLVTMLALWAALLGGLLLVFNTGQTAAAKMRVVNAADAAAYSAAVWQARALNLQAYANRAIVANEAAIAQLVSLRSWSAYLQRTASNGATALSWVPYLNAVLSSVARGWQPVDRGLQSGLPHFESLASRINNDLLAPAEHAAHAQAFATSLLLARQVLQDSLPGARLDQATAALAPGSASRWQAATRSFGRAAPDRARLARVVMDARDGFTRGRGWNLDAGVIVAAKRGGTDLIAGQAWRGMDTLSIHLPDLFGSSELPAGWGAAELRNTGQSARGEHGGSWSRNPRASRLANRANHVASGYRGLPAYRDVASLRSSATPVIRVVIGASLDGTEVPGSATAMGDARTVVPGEAAMSYAPRFAGGQVRALSVAAVGFRPAGKRRDGRVEYASLFSPYWQARLVAPGLQERASAAAARGQSDPWLATR